MRLGKHGVDLLTSVSLLIGIVMVEIISAPAESIQLVEQAIFSRELEHSGHAR